MRNAKQFEKGETCERSEKGATMKRNKERCWGGMVERLAVSLLGRGAEASETSRVKARARQAEAEHRSSRTKTAALVRSAGRGGKRQEGAGHAG